MNLPTEIWVVIGELAAFVYGELETNFGDPFAAPPQFDIAIGVQKTISTRRSLVLVSRAFYAAFTSLLYRSIILEDAKSLHRLAQTLKAQRSLDISQRNGRWTRRLCLITKRERHWGDLPTIGTEDLLEDLPRLQILGIRGCLTRRWHFPFDLSRGCKELTALHASYFSIKLPDHVQSPRAFSDAFPNLCHTVVQGIYGDQYVGSSYPGLLQTPFIDHTDPSLRFLHCSVESINPFLCDAQNFPSLTLTGLTTMTSTIDNLKSFSKIIAWRVTTLDFSGADPRPCYGMVIWAAKCAHLETLVINFHTLRLIDGFPTLPTLRHLGLFATMSQTRRADLNDKLNGLYTFRQSTFPRLANIRFIQPSFSTHVVQRYTGRVVDWTGRFSSKGVRLENYKGDLLSSGIRFSESIFVRPVLIWCSTEAQEIVNMDVGNG